MLAFVHPDDHQATLDERRRLPENGTTVAFVNRYATKDGGWRWIDWNTRFDPDEQLIYATARDIAMTAGAMQEDRDHAKAAGMDDYLAKPVRRKDVLAAVARWAGAPAPAG